MKERPATAGSVGMAAMAARAAMAEEAVQAAADRRKPVAAI